MNENTKLYVFAKKEVALIFIFMVLIAVSAFVLGVKIGKNYSYLQSGLTPEDRAKVEMLSTQEEQQMDITDQRKPIDPQELKDETHKALEERLKEQLEKEDAPEVEMKSPEEESTTQVSGDEFDGKFTIQLGSHRSKKESEEFANGFKYRGYNPIINEVEISGRGTWYRTSLGVFSSIEEAKAYIKKEMELFRGQDYVIGRFE
jgi:cell division septation protein DedD